MANEHVAPDIVTRTGYDVYGMSLLADKYDAFFKIASGLEVADKADGDVESPQGWYAYIDMSAEKHVEVVNAVDQLTPGFVEEMPAAGFYVTQTNTQGQIYAFEFNSAEKALEFYAGLEAGFSRWSNSGNTDHLPEEYVWLRAWGEMMRSSDYYIASEQSRAALDCAPIESIYRDLKTHGFAAWHTMSGITNKSARDYLTEWGRQRGITVPESVQQVWDTTDAH